MARTGKRLSAPAGGFREIAVLRLSSLGDVILGLPVARALAAAWPDARLSYWTREEYADVVRHHPAVSHVRVLERDACRIEDLVSMGAELEDCDLIVDLHGSLRTHVLTFRQKAPVLKAPSYRLARARLVHARWSRPLPPPPAVARFARALEPLGLVVDSEPVVHAGKDAEEWAAAWLAAWGAGPAPVALCPGARHFTKRWPEEHWRALHDVLLGAGHRLLYFSLGSERRSMPALAARVEGQPRARWCVEPLARMGALLGRCAAAVSCDSGLMHLAAACGLKLVALFGSTVPELGFAPAGAGHEVLCRHEPCQPCTLHGRRSCPKGHFRCMTDLKPGDVAAALERLLA
jgi:heptosyltransferase-2